MSAEYSTKECRRILLAYNSSSYPVNSSSFLPIAPFVPVAKGFPSLFLGHAFNHTLMNIKLVSSFLVSVLALPALQAQSPGEFDLSYGVNGKRILPLGTANAFSRSMVIQPDGKAVLACITNNATSNDFAVVRLLENGQPDPDFGTGGIVSTDFFDKTDVAEAVALDEFNRIIVAGYVEQVDGFEFAVARYLPDGRLDETFDGDGRATVALGATAFCKDVAIQADNKIVIGGYVLNPLSATNEYTLVRFDTTGQLDPTFDGEGIVMTHMGMGAGVANALTIQPDGKIVLAGQVFNEATFFWEIGIARYDTDGTLDPAWDHDGIVFAPVAGVNPTINEIVLQSDDKIIVGGYSGTAPSNNKFTVARFHSNGTPDESFDEDGIVIDSYGFEDNQINAMVLQPDGHLIIAGTTLVGNVDRFALARLDAAGHFDEPFGDEGKVVSVISQNDGISAMALQGDGKLVVAGESFDGTRFNIVAARYQTGLMTRVEDPDQRLSEVSVYPNPVRDHFTIYFTTPQASEYRVALYDMNGRVVHAFSDNFRLEGNPHELRYTFPDAVMPGIYTLSLTSRDEKRSVLVVLQ